MDCKKLKLRLQQFSNDREWNKFHTLKNLACSISIESSELLEIFQWEDLSSLENRQKELKEKVSDEVADIMLYLLRFSDLAEIDLEKACFKKIEKNEKKYPVNLSKGNSKKYTDL